MNEDQVRTIVGEEENIEMISELPLYAILLDPDQPRKDFDEEKLRELAESIDNQGLLSPILVRPQKDGKFELVYGERRYRAHELLGKNTIKCIVRRIDDQEKSIFQLAENILREDLNPIEEAIAFQRLNSEHGFTHEQIAKKIGKSRTYITNKLRLLQLSSTIQEAITEGKISGGHAIKLLSVNNDTKRDEIAHKIIEKKLSIRETTQLITPQQNVSCETSVEVGKTIDPRILKIRSLLLDDEFLESVPVQTLISVMIQDLKFLRGG